jgi:hypothetical protein
MGRVAKAERSRIMPIIGVVEPDSPADTSGAPVPLDLFAASVAEKTPARRRKPAPAPAPPPLAPAPLAAAPSPREPTHPPAPPPAAPSPSRPSPPASKASLLKRGYGLYTRSAEGDDSITPFRSLEDLLSAVKPILRATAGNPEPIWFSIQPVDLASIDIEGG